MPLFFEVFFSIAVISRIESIGGGWVEGGWGGWWQWMGSCKQTKENIQRSNTKGSAVPSVGDPYWHKLTG